MKSEDLTQLFESFNHHTIAVVGDVMLDKYIFGSVSRISPEAPVPVIDVHEESFRLGGAANVAMNLHSLGANVSLFGITGDDSAREALLEEMIKQDFSPDNLVKDTSRKTTCKTRVIAQNHHIVRVDSETKSFINDTIETQLIDQFKMNSEHFRALIFEDYNKGLLTASLIERLIKISQEKNLPTLVDPKKLHFFDYKNCTVFKPNLKETSEALSTSFNNTDKDAETACEILKDRINCNYVVLTRGEKGLSILNDRSIHHIPSVALDVADVSGAGDTVISVLAMALCSGLSIEDSGKLANFAAGIVCSEVGAVSINKRKLMDYCLANF